MAVHADEPYGGMEVVVLRPLGLAVCAICALRGVGSLRWWTGVRCLTSTLAGLLLYFLLVHMLPENYHVSVSSNTGV